MPKPLTAPVLRRLTTEALVSFLGHSESFEAVLHPDCVMVLSNEPAADLNYVVAGRGAAESGHFEAGVRVCIARGLPFLAILFPEAAEETEKLAGELGLAYAVDFPFMVRDDAPVESAGADGIVIQEAVGRAPANEVARVLSTAFKLPEASLRRAFPPSLLDGPGVDAFLALRAGVCVGSVIITHHGDAAGIWAMGTDPEVQGQGIGRRLLTSLMAQSRERGVRRFFLGATPSGLPLYESLGFEARAAAQVWGSRQSKEA